MMKTLTYLFLGAATVQLAAETTGPKTFATPEEARDALIQAATTGNLEAMREIFGPEAARIARTGDEVEDKNLREKFRARAAEKIQLDPDDSNPNRIDLLIGNEEWPFAVPLIRKNGRWYFDAKEGEAEIRRRIIGGDELDAIDICEGYVEAQQKYVDADRNGKGVVQYASKIISSPGKKDGLYWPGEDSPVGEAFAKAVAEGYSPVSGKLTPFHGYFFKVLTAQGDAAKDGAQDFMVHGLMIGGYGLVAWPAQYGVSGIMTFIVNQDGVVYQKDLGPQTATLAKAMTKFNPDKSWEEPPQ